jgi:lysophospholipase L1-like esterase
MKKIFVFILLGLIVFIGFRLFYSVPEIKNTNPTGKNIICFGDSLTYGTGSSKKGMDYPSQLSRIIGRPVINAGIPGDTTARALERLEEDVLSRSPRIVLITLGGNDLKNRVPKETTFKNLRVIIESIQNTGALVIVAGIDIPFWGGGFGKSYEELCDEVGAVLIPNIFKGIMGKRHLMSDPIHPNDAGYKLFAEKFHKKMKPYL